MDDSTAVLDDGLSSRRTGREAKEAALVDAVGDVLEEESGRTS